VGARKKLAGLPEWEEVLSAACRLQQILPDAVLVGGTATSLHAQHRVSRDADHVLQDLRDRFDEVLARLEQIAGWKTARTARPVQILGALDGIMTGVRQMIRTEPLETLAIATRSGPITIPTAAEMLRIKSALILTRNATRDYVDFAALSDGLGWGQSVRSLERFEQLYPQPHGESALQQLAKQLADPRPYDLDDVDLAEYRHLVPRWQAWKSIVEQCAGVAVRLIDHLASAAEAPSAPRTPARRVRGKSRRSRPKSLRPGKGSGKP